MRPAKRGRWGFLVAPAVLGLGAGLAWPRAEGGSEQGWDASLVRLPAEYLASMGCLGNPVAPVEVVVYYDPLSPDSAALVMEEELEVVRTYVSAGQVRLVARVVTLAAPESGTVGKATYCAGQQGRFWHYRATAFAVFQRHGAAWFPRPGVAEAAEMAGLGADEITACADSDRPWRAVEEDLHLAESDAIKVLPTVLIDSRRFEGRQPFGTYLRAIEERLARN